jgi:hypothetical protein
MPWYFQLRYLLVWREEVPDGLVREGKKRPSLQSSFRLSVENAAMQLLLLSGFPESSGTVFVQGL